MDEREFDPVIGDWIYPAEPEMPDEDSWLPIWEVMDWGDIYPR